MPESRKQTYGFLVGNKALSKKTPTFSNSIVREHWNKLEAILNRPDPPVSRKTESKHIESRDAIRGWLQALSPNFVTAEKVGTSEELAALRDVVKAISLSAKKNVLTEREADAVMRFIIEQFIQKRMRDVLADVFSVPHHGQWFMAAHGDWNE